MKENCSTLVLDAKEYQIGDIVLRKKAKIFYAIKDHPDIWMMRCTDDVTQDHDGNIKEEIPGKGRLCAKINATLFELLKGQYTDEFQATPIKTHFIKTSPADDASCLVRRMAQAIPLEVIVRNYAYGSYLTRKRKRKNVTEGVLLDPPICEFTVKNDAKKDPLITRSQIIQRGIATNVEVDHMREVALAVNRILSAFFLEIGIELADLKLVFGRKSDLIGDYTNICIIGELTPDVFRLRDMKTRRCLDKDIFRRGLPGLSEAYSAVLQRMQEARALQEEERRMACQSENYPPQ